MVWLQDCSPVDADYFHSADGAGFPLAGCTYQLLDRDGNPTGRPTDTSCPRVRAANGERFCLRGCDIAHFLNRIGWPGGVP